MLTELQIDILNYTKNTYFHGTVNEYLKISTHSEKNVIDAIKDLRKKRIISMSSDIMNSWIGVTNYGWKIMGWSN